MGRLKQTRKFKRSSTACIFCGDDYRVERMVKRLHSEINYIHIPPLNNEFHTVCDNCIPVLESFKVKYPYLWE